ncbi:hypothetical protein XA68_16146 [Ophiocordyceps unilateralis]|uniref:Carbonic anhydrase n=1 Tax=Ophiocordyceps unilateralis TaxID=268505 RepID=A0A2A9PLP7_OPHUN|nr:hypothetical protein XA68_16146 [Ophiocordyceps unilateralis]
MLSTRCGALLSSALFSSRSAFSSSYFAFSSSYFAFSSSYFAFSSGPSSRLGIAILCHRPVLPSRLVRSSRFSSSKPPSWSLPAPLAASPAPPAPMKDDDMHKSHGRLLENNRAWAADQQKRDPGFFARLCAGQSPEFLWIGCSDSRIPAELITGLEPGEAFIHRNIANLVVNTDLNVMSVINYAVRHLGVKQIIVCGHYGCGGVQAAMTPKDLGILNPWLRNIRDVYRLHEAQLDAIADDEARYNRLVELNVEEQCRNVVKTAAVQQSYAQNQYPVVRGYVFGFQDGLLKDLEIDFEAMLANVQKIYNLAN